MNDNESMLVCIPGRTDRVELKKLTTPVGVKERTLDEARAIVGNERFARFHLAFEDVQTIRVQQRIIDGKPLPLSEQVGYVETDGTEMYLTLRTTKNAPSRSVKVYMHCNGFNGEDVKGLTHAGTFVWDTGFMLHVFIG